MWLIVVGFNGINQRILVESQFFEVGRIAVRHRATATDTDCQLNRGLKLVLNFSCHEATGGFTVCFI